jgi:NAD+ synthetase
MIQLTLAQLNPTVGDIEGNVELILAAAASAGAGRSAAVVKGAADEVTRPELRPSAHLIAFPELSLTGYYPMDLLDEPDFLPRVEAGLHRLVEASREAPQAYWVVGAPVLQRGPGKRLNNSLLVIHDGRVRLEYAKQLLPTYDVFDERRHFEPGPDVARVLRVGDVQVGFLICEDGWNDDGLSYGINPFARLSEAAPDLVVSINASPSSIGRREARQAVFVAASQRYGLPIVYVNQVGGQDSLVYDGASFVVEPSRGVVFEARRFEPDVATMLFSPDSTGSGHGTFVTPSGEPCPEPRDAGLSTPEFYRRQIVLGLRDYARRCGFRRALVGSSGGIDSALTLALAAEALGPDNVVAVTLPSRYSSAGSVNDSVLLCKNLGVELLTHPIADLVAGFSAQFESSFGPRLAGVPLENLQARVRGTVLMEYSNHFGCLLLTTGNKSEVSVGYCTLYGDTNGGLGLIGDLYKTEVYALSRHLNESAGREVIPAAILEKPPSAELAPGQKDTDSLPAYELLDEVLKLLIEGKRLAPWEYERAQACLTETSRTPEGRALIHRIRLLVARTEYKRRQAPPILRVRFRAFGVGRQMPITARLLPDLTDP